MSVILIKLVQDIQYKEIHNLYILKTNMHCE